MVDRFIRLCLVVMLSLLAAPAIAGPVSAVDLAIVVSLDRSRSIDDVDAVAQIDGLLHTLRHSEFAEAVAHGRHGRVALSVVTWSSFGHHEVILPWIAIADRRDARRAAIVLEADTARRKTARHGSLTDHDLAIEVGLGQFGRLPWRTAARVINVVADGVGNIRRMSAIDRDDALRRGVTINGLVMAHGAEAPRLVEYFRREVVGGPTSFVLVSHTAEGFAAAMLRKMVREIVLLRPAPGRSRLPRTEG